MIECRVKPKVEEGTRVRDGWSSQRKSVYAKKGIE
jgi:hypothetical protein